LIKPHRTSPPIIARLCYTLNVRESRAGIFFNIWLSRKDAASKPRPSKYSLVADRLLNIPKAFARDFTAQFD